MSRIPSTAFFTAIFLLVWSILPWLSRSVRYTEAEVLLVDLQHFLEEGGLAHPRGSTQHERGGA
jgi:hypothetical protein